MLRKKDSNSKEEEKSKLERIKDEVINSIFGVFYILLKNSESSLCKFIVFMAIQCLQMLSYSFQEELGHVWKSETIINYLTSFLSTFRVVYWIEHLSWDIYIIIYYVCIFVIFLVIIDFVYVAYCYKNRKFPFMWPVQLLRYSCHLLNTILFIPFLELFMSFSKCQQDSVTGQLVHKVFTHVECFSGIHILHVVLSYFIIIVFFLMCLIITQCFYESRLGRDPLAKMKSGCNVIALIAKFIYVFIFTVFGHPQHYWFLSVVLFIGSALVFVAFAKSRPYFHETTQRSVNILNGIFFWTNTVLLFSCFVYSLDLTANLAIYVMGLPFVVMIIVNIKDSRKTLLMNSTNQNEQNPEDLHHQINYYLQIIDSKEESREAALTLKGYVNYHSEYCMLDNCPLKNFKKQQQKDLKKQYGQFGQLTSVYIPITSKNQITSLESHPLLMQQAKLLYNRGTKKFPKYTALRIDYAQFLLYRMHNKKDALKELMSAEKRNPNFEQQFMIFRYRHIIEDELHEGTDNAGGLDYVAAINFENHFSLFKQLIEKSSLLHYEFWNHLMDDSPDLARLSEQGARINASIQAVEDQWKKLTQQSTQTPKALRMYASYLIEILNDKELGNEQLQKAKETAVLRMNFDLNNMHEDSSDMSTFAPDGSPCVYISGEQDRLGIITQCNMSVCRVFGYSKKEDLVNHDVEVLMPKIYAKYHKKFLEQALQKPPDLLSNKERQVFGKHYSGFVFPLWLSVKNLPSFLSGRQFVATFKVEKSGINKNVAHLILDKNKEVIDISATCISMLGIDLHKFQGMKAQFDLSLLLPTLFGANQYQFQNKAGFQIEYQFPELVEIDKKNDPHNHDNIEDATGNFQLNDEDEHNHEDRSMEFDPEMLRLQKNNGFDVSLVEDEDEALLNEGNYTGVHKKRSSNNLMMKQSRLMNGFEQIYEVEGEDEDCDDMDTNERNQIANKMYDYKVVPQASKTAIFQCNMVEIHFETQNLENPNPGYYIKLETLQDKTTGIAKIQKTLKQNAFQFSYDPIYKRFCRELRDKENKDILIDKNYLALKKLKEGLLQQLKSGVQGTIPLKVQNMSYMTYLHKYQKWIERDQQGSILDDDQSEVSSNNSDSDEEDDSLTLKRGSSSATPTPQNNTTAANPLENTLNPNLVVGADYMDLKKFIPGEGSGKEFLKSEIERMINILRQKQEMGDGVHIFRRMEPNQKLNSALAQSNAAIGQHGRFEEVQFSTASLFSGRSAEKVADLDDDHDYKDEDSDRDKSSKNDNIKNSIKSRKAFQMAINDKSVPPAIKRLSRIANVLLLCLLALAIADYSIHYAQLKDTIVNYEVIDNSYKRIAEIQKVCYNVRSMIMLNEKVLTNYQGFPTINDLVNSIKKDLQSSLKLLYDIQNQINLSKLDVSEKHYALLDEKTVNLYFKQDIGQMKSLKFSLTEAILQIQSSIFTVSNMNLEEFSEVKNEDVFFLMYNAFNDLYQAMRESSNLYVMELQSRSEAKLEVSLILFILSIVGLFALVTILVPVVASVNRQKDKVLSLFCEIDDYSIRMLSVRCEKFLNKLQASEDNGNDEGMDSNEDFDQVYGYKSSLEEEDDYSGMMGFSGKRKKSAKNNTRTDKFFYVKFVVAVLIVEAYYSYNYGMMRDYQTMTEIQAKGYNLTATMEPYYWFTLNAQREMLYNQSKIIIQKPAFQMAQGSIFRLYQLTGAAQQVHLQNEEYFPEEYRENFQSIMEGNVCPDLESRIGYFGSVESCENFASGIPKQGLNLMLLSFIRTMRLQLSQSQLFSKHQTLLNSLINSQQMYELYVLQHYFIQNLMRELMDDISDSIIGGLDVRLQNRLFMLILFLILLLLAYVVLWLPLVNSLTNQIYKTKLMLMIIPLEILMRMKNVGKVLQSQNFIQEQKTSRSSKKSSSRDIGN